MIAPTEAPVAAPEAGIVLRWLARLRWFAVAGQTLAVLIAVLVLKVPLPLTAIQAVIAVTAISNLAIQFWLRYPASQDRVWPWLVPAVLMLDVFLLTALLLCSGGASNPFGVLYMVHVAMAVVTLTESWAWLVATTAIACYGFLFLWPRAWQQPLVLSEPAAGAADWVALTLVAILIAYFVGRMTGSLRRHQKALAEARDRAARNERLASLTTLAAGAAHELNTPLSTIAVVARELEVQSAGLQDGGEGFVQDAKLIRQEVNRCQFILGRMRVDVLQGESPAEQAEPTSIADFLAELRGELWETEDTLRIRCDPSLDKIALPGRTLRQALTILIDNALDASPPGKAVDLSIAARNGHIVFEVRDQGPGMGADVMRRAGEPFFTTKPPGEGMGLGLFLVRLLAERLDGSLTLHSAPGQGTRAVLELPKNA